MLKEELLKNDIRRKIFRFLEVNPGLHLRELQRRLALPLTTTEYHLEYMARRNVIYKEKDGRFNRFYTKLLDEEDKEVFSILRQRRLREIVLVILGKDGAKFRELQEILALPSSTLSYYIKRLMDNAIITKDQIGSETIYRVKDERAIKALIIYKPSFIDKLVDQALYAFMEPQFKKMKKE
jgi:predicted transcriptional regulator